MRVLIFFVVFIGGMTFQSLAQISGTVTDAESGEVLAGVNILIKGTSTGTSTDANGQYELDAESLRDTLVVTFVGYQSNEVPMDGRTEINIKMQSETISGEEMVVVGYGTQKRENLTSAVSSKKMEDITDVKSRPSADVGKVLQGAIPGLNIKRKGGGGGSPDYSPEFNIRGFNSLSGGSPLVLVDGREEDIYNVNPDDVEEVTVLKDAASAAIYGGRAAFGVILITTKDGREGAFNIKYNSNFSLSTNTTRTDYLSDPYEYAKTVDGAIGAYNGSCYICYNDEDWDIIKGVADGEIEPYHEKQSDGTYKFYHNTDFYDVMFRKRRPAQMHYLTLSGGSEKINGYFSGRIYKRQKIQNIQDASMNRYNFTGKVNFKPYDWLDFTASTKYSDRFGETYAGTKNGWGGAYGVSRWRDQFPNYPAFIDGMGVSVGRSRNGYTARTAALKEGGNWRKKWRKNLTTMLEANLNPIEGWEVHLDWSYNIKRRDRKYRYTPFEYLAGNQLEERTGGLDRLGEWRDRYEHYTVNAYSSYTQDLDKHHFKLMLGYNHELYHSDTIRAQMEELLSRSKSNLAFGTEMYKTDGNATDWGLQGYFGRFNYDYDSRYFLEVSTRYDGSSRFPKGERWGLFPSASVGWQVDNEEFWSSSLENVISSLKLRVSYGRLGNQQVGVNTFRQLVGMGRTSWLDPDGNESNVYARVPSPLPADIGWEKVTSTNLGADFGFLENKLTASVDLYERNTSDMYLPGEPLPAVFGASEPNRSYASLRNRGFELEVGYNDQFEVMGSPLSFSVSANVSNYKGVITRFDNPEGLMSTYWEGQELGEIWGYRIDGQFQSDEEAAAYQSKFDNVDTDLAKVYGSIFNKTSNQDWNHLRAGDIKYVDVNGDGKIDNGDNTLEDHGDLERIGNAMPKFPFGFNINANWHDFDVFVDAAGVAKQDWYPTGPMYWGTYHRPYASFLRKDLLDNAWSEENPGGKFPQTERAYQALNSGRSLYNVNDYYLTNIGYLRIKNITVGYTLPQELTQKIDIKRLRVYVSGENMLTWRFGGLTKYIDPEVAGAAVSYGDPGSATARSPANEGRYPMPKTYSVGVEINF